MKLRLGMLGAAAFVLLALPLRSAQAAAPCTSALPTCAEWVGSAASGLRLRVYRTFPLDQRNTDITRAFILVHGMGRNADGYYKTALAAAFLTESLGKTLVLAPHFASNNGASCRDTLAADELNWGCEGPSRWTAGGAATNDAQVTSFDLADRLLRLLANKDIFPNLTQIVLAGHSAGGQFAARYAMANTVHEGLGVAVSYVVANPSSYAYLDSQRPTAAAFPRNVAALPPGYAAPLAEPPPPPFRNFADARNCTAYDEWPFGLRHRAGYAAKLSDDSLKTQLAARPVTYALGGLDILPLFGFDGSCPAMAQGPTRLARGLAFARHVNERFGARHKTLLVPSCGHSARCMFTADNVMRLVFEGSAAP